VNSCEQWHFTLAMSSGHNTGQRPWLHAVKRLQCKMRHLSCACH
jgi:hypothetical protein